MRQLIRKLVPKSALKPLLQVYHLTLAVTGQIRYGFPGRGMRVVMVTGTNGKTTTTLLIGHILQSAGHKVGLSSTIEFWINGEREVNLTNRTNLGRWQFAKLLKRMKDAGCDTLVTEASSEGIAWQRLWGVPTDMAVFTNLSEDHLDFHGTMEEYRNTKGRIFARLTRSRRLADVPKVSVVNSDDAEAKYFLTFQADRRLSYAFERRADFKGTKFQDEDGRINFSVNEDGANHAVDVPLTGRFNGYNALASVAAARGWGVDWKTITEALRGFGGVAGRLELVDEGQDFRVVVDYAHSEDALRNVYQTLNESKGAGRLIGVLGATGDRQRDKRPILGQVAAELCDVVYVTDEEPYTEDPKAIIAAVAEGVRSTKLKTEERDFFVIGDRTEAIRAAIDGAKKGDTVAITGMGHQQSRTVGTKKEAWDDREEARKALRRVK